MPADASPGGEGGPGLAPPAACAPGSRGGRSAHLPVDDALAPFADMLRQHLPTPDEIEQTAAMRQQRRKRLVAAGAVAGVALLALALWADPALQHQRLVTAVGERQQWQLADGSQVQLNTGSQVLVAQHLRSRRLVLVAGEASFEVAHAWWHRWAPGLQRPFTVQAGAVVVQDIGTVFAVRRRDEGRAGQAARMDPAARVDAAQVAGTDVSVLQGRVRVLALDGAGAPVELGAGQRLRLRPGLPGQLTWPTAAPDAPDALATAADAALAWRQGRLVFDGTALSDAVADMQRYRSAPIVVADSQVAALRISGEFDLERIDQLLDLLPRLAPVRVQREADGRVVIASRHRPRP